MTRSVIDIPVAYRPNPRSALCYTDDEDIQQTVVEIQPRTIIISFMAIIEGRGHTMGVVADEVKTTLSFVARNLNIPWVAL